MEFLEKPVFNINNHQEKRQYKVRTKVLNFENV